MARREDLGLNWFHPHAVTRRAQHASAFVLFSLGVVLVRFFLFQVVGSEDFSLRSDENRLRPVRLPAPRGIVVDRNGLVLAENVPGFMIAVLAESEDALRETLQRIAQLASVDSLATEDAVERWRERPTDRVVVIRDAPIDVVARLEERRVILPGLLIQTEPKRSYPMGETVSHALGYIGEVSSQELANNSFVGAYPGMMVGRNGLERQYDNRLRGEDGVDFVEVDARGQTVRATGGGRRVEPEQGDTLHTTLDADLQLYVAAMWDTLFPGSRGSVIAIDPRDGGILSLYSAPSYDPNAFVGRSELPERLRLLQAPDQPLFNRATQGRYPPASLWKLAVAAIALNRGLVTLDSRMHTPCTGGYQYGNRFFRCWYSDGHGAVTLREAIRHSCDVYFYQLGLLVGLENLLEDGTRIGFGELTGIDLPGERQSLYPSSTAYYDEHYGPRGWTPAVTLNLAIGQGENDQTPINMTAFYAMLASNGVSVIPHLVDVPDMKPRDLAISAEDLAGLRTSLIEVVTEGTASGAAIRNLEIAGKTGTAQNSQGADHGWFIGFAPASNPRVLVSAIVEFAEHGSRVAPLVNCVIARYLLGPAF
ncbi:MAG: penicillin-binding protein 2, partial [Gemmatimonadales bacterium]